MNWGRFCLKRSAWCVLRRLLTHHASRFSLLLLMSVWYVARPQPLFAHNELRQSIPTAGAILAASPPEIHLFFSEPPAGVFIKLFDLHFQEIPGLNILPIESNPNEVITLVPELENGTYTVQWLTLSADNHSVTGTFQFEVQRTTPSFFSNLIIGGVLAAAILVGIVLFIKQNRTGVSSKQSPTT